METLSVKKNNIEKHSTTFVSRDAFRDKLCFGRTSTGGDERPQPSPFHERPCGQNGKIANLFSFH